MHTLTQFNEISYYGRLDGQSKYASKRFGKQIIKLLAAQDGERKGRKKAAQARSSKYDRKKYLERKARKLALTREKKLKLLAQNGEIA